MILSLGPIISNPEISTRLTLFIVMAPTPSNSITGLEKSDEINQKYLVPDPNPNPVPVLDPDPAPVPNLDHEAK